MVIVEVAEIPKLDLIKDVSTDDPATIYNICQGMKEVCEKEKGIGLSAVQVGLPLKLFMVKGDGTCPIIPLGEYGYFANTEYKATTEERVVSLEGCLSIRSQDGQLRSFQVERSKSIIIKGLKFNIDKMLYEEFSVELGTNQQSVVFEHEIDHQRGTLISDIGQEIFIW